MIRRPVTVGSLMILVALIGIPFVALRALLAHDESFGFGTV
jgi:hypothetical protein